MVGKWPGGHQGCDNTPLTFPIKASRLISVGEEIIVFYGASYSSAVSSFSGKRDPKPALPVPGSTEPIAER